MNRLGKHLIAVTVASVLILGVPFPGPAAERKTELSVTYDAPRLSVEAKGVSLQRILGEIGEKLGFVVVDYGGSDRLLTFSIQDASVEEVLGQLLRGENYAVVYDGQRKEIAKVLLLTSSVQASTENQQTEKGHERIVQSPVGLTYHSPVSPPSLFEEQKRPDKAKAEVKVEDIMRAHALSGLIDPIGMLSGTADVPQPFGSPTGSSFSTGAMSTSPPRQDIHETLAVTTRLAQQNLKALVDGLAAASSSLFQSLPNGER
jgi:hypothetical protein